MPAKFISAYTYGVQPLAMPALFISADTDGVQPLAMPALSWLTATYQIQDLQCYCFVHEYDRLSMLVSNYREIVVAGFIPRPPTSDRITLVQNATACYC
ncbi:hypothetical protein ACLKA7_001275 [Drosophila subpalustris]